MQKHNLKLIATSRVLWLCDRRRHKIGMARFYWSYIEKIDRNYLNLKVWDRPTPQLNNARNCMKQFFIPIQLIHVLAKELTTAQVFGDISQKYVYINNEHPNAARKPGTTKE